MIDFHFVNKFEIRTFKSLFMTVLQLINCIIRYTIVQIPFCIKVLGLVYGPATIVIVGCISIYSVWLLISVKFRSEEK